MRAINELLEIMHRLRDPEKGCPWDKAQTFESILPYTLEEVYELVQTIEDGDMEGLRDELGDLLFHLVYYARLAEEAGHFNFEAVVREINEKLQRRHPHVFAGEQIKTAAEQTLAWERIKEEERGSREAGQLSLLDGVSAALPAVIRAHKLQKRAASKGFDWDTIGPVLDKIEEELAELRHEIEETQDREKVMAELGDLLFACVNLARHAQVDPELALRKTNRKFEQRFKFIESELAKAGRGLDDVSLDEMEALWQKAKGLGRA